MKKLVIATRRSRLALWQAEHIAKELKQIHRGLVVDFLPLSTRGDELLDRRLDDAGGKARADSHTRAMLALPPWPNVRLLESMVQAARARGPVIAAPHPGQTGPDLR